MATESTTARVLRLLALLQQRPSWTAADLAAELQVTDRSIRRDVDRLRSLGYPVRATAGVGGGYRLGAGTRLPPLLLDDDEATAAAVSLRLAAGSAVSGAGEAALRALAKLDQVMPPRLRAEVSAVHHATETLIGTAADIDPELLVGLAHACRDEVQVRFTYTDATGSAHERRVEPIRLVTTGNRWYLMAFDLDRDDWRTFRLDRLADLHTTTWRFRPREHPEPAAFVQRAITTAPYRHHVRVRLHAAADEVRRRVPPQVGQVDDVGQGWCLLTAGGDDLVWLALHIAALGYETEILEPPELRRTASHLAGRLAAMATPSVPGEAGERHRAGGR